MTEIKNNKLQPCNIPFQQSKSTFLIQSITFLSNPFNLRNHIICSYSSTLTFYNAYLFHISIIKVITFQNYLRLCCRTAAHVLLDSSVIYFFKTKATLCISTIITVRNLHGSQYYDTTHKLSQFYLQETSPQLCNVFFHHAGLLQSATVPHSLSFIIFAV